ncbi:MAG: hypothetical protein A2W23_01670, partial [Planctomycetes bacterium RBG_16_43_13]
MNRKIALITTKYGSIDIGFRIGSEKNVSTTPPGIAHFLEHQLFKKQEGDALAAFGKYGASSNAFTDYCNTTYFFTSTGNFGESLKILLEFVFKPYFNEQNIEKEKFIIEQELKMYDDMPDYRMYKNLMSILYKEHPVRIDIGGTVESVKAVKKDMLVSCYNKFYNPANMILVFSGDLEPYEIFTLSDKLIPKNEQKEYKIDHIIPNEPSGIIKKSVTQNMTVSMPRILIGFKDPSNTDGTEDTLIKEIATGMALELLFGRGTKFYNNVYESGLIDDTFSYSHNSEDTFAFSVIGGETSEPDKLIEEVLFTINKAKQNGFKRHDVEVGKRKRFGKFLKVFDSPDSAAFSFAECNRKDTDIFNIPTALKKINRDILI